MPVVATFHMMRPHHTTIVSSSRVSLQHRDTQTKAFVEYIDELDFREPVRIATRPSSRSESSHYMELPVSGH
jgi:hypothetical protein